MNTNSILLSGCVNRLLLDGVKAASFATVFFLIGVVGLSAEGGPETEEVVLKVELNNAQQTDNGCKLTFLIENSLGADATKLSFETVIFDKDDVVKQLTLLDFQSAPQAKPRVRQFEIPKIQCSALGKLLFNGTESCEAKPLAAAICAERLKLKSKTSIELVG